MFDHNNTGELALGDCVDLLSTMGESMSRPDLSNIMLEVGIVNPDHAGGDKPKLTFDEVVEVMKLIEDCPTDDIRLTKSFVKIDAIHHKGHSEGTLDVENFKKQLCKRIDDEMLQLEPEAYAGLLEEFKLAEKVITDPADEEKLLIKYEEYLAALIEASAAKGKKGKKGKKK